MNMILSGIADVTVFLSMAACANASTTPDQLESNIVRAPAPRAENARTLPEPASLGLMAGGLAVGAVRRRMAR